MIYGRNKKSGQRGATLVEFAVGATVFLTAMFAVIEFGRALWTHNALSDAARRAARYAINQPASTPPGVKTSGTDVGPSIGAIKNVALYGDPAGGTQPLLPDLTTANVHVIYQQFGLLRIMPSNLCCLSSAPQSPCRIIKQRSLPKALESCPEIPDGTGPYGVVLILDSV